MITEPQATDKNIRAWSPTVRLLAGVAVLIPLGFGTKLYQGPGAEWVHAYAGALCYEIFWVFVLRLLLSRAPILPLAAAVFLVTSTLEFTQLSRDPRLESVRSFYLGRALIGDGFDPWDFAYYAAGCTLAVVLYRCVVAPQSRSR